MTTATIARSVIAPHYGHEIVVAQYTDQEGRADEFSIECLDCERLLFTEKG